MHDTAGEMAQPTACATGRRASANSSPARPPQITVVERDYPNLYKRFTPWAH